MVDLPGLARRNKDRLAALASLADDELALGAVLAELRTMLQTSGAAEAVTDSYVGTARDRVKDVANTLADPAADLAEWPSLARLWWVDELLTALARARIGRTMLAPPGLEGDRASILDEGPPNVPPVAQDDGYELKHDTTLSVPAPGMLMNDYDPLGDPISAALVAGPAHAISFSFSSDGSFSYTPSHHYVGTDSFVYQITDGQYTDSATVFLEVWNMLPSAGDDAYELKHDTTLSVPAPGVTSNDSDPDGDPISASLVSGPAHASSFTFNADGSFTYTPAYHYVGTDSFTYYATDGIANSATTTVSIDVRNHAPVANNDGPYMTLSGIPLTVPARGVLANDSDMDGEPIQAVFDRGSLYGYVGLNADGSFQYDPAGYVGTDSFTYKAFDQIDYSDPATVNLAVVDMRLNWVTFGGGLHVISEDPGGAGGTYASQQWLDNNLNGNVTDPGDHQWPVAYTRSDGGDNFLHVSASWQLDRAWTGGPILVRATATGGITIPPTPASVMGTTVTLPDTAATVPFATSVQHYDNFDIHWEASSDGGTTWTDVGSSSNDLYLTLHNPTVNPLYHTVVHIGSHNAAGQNTDNGTVEAAWGEFTDNDVKRIRDNLTMVYSHERRDSTGRIIRDVGYTAAEMLADAEGEGQCTAWADLWLQVLAGQGIWATSTRIDPDYPYIRFRVRQMPAQGSGGANYTDQTDFGFHQVVRVSGFPDAIFDPSYGTRVDKADARPVELKYEDENITHLRLGDLTWVADTKGVRQLVFTP